jgi:hypothetical protein
LAWRQHCRARQQLAFADPEPPPCQWAHLRELAHGDVRARRRAHRRRRLQVIPGSHKASFPIPPETDLTNLLVEVAMPAGSMLLFTHNIYHASFSSSDAERRIIMFTYCRGVIANSGADSSVHDRLFDAAAEGTWLKHLLRRPHGFEDTDPPPEH